MSALGKFLCIAAHRWLSLPSWGAAVGTHLLHQHGSGLVRSSVFAPILPSIRIWQERPLEFDLLQIRT